MAAVILFPAIDLKGGRCVRLKRGEMKSATVFNENPADQARLFARAGFRWLHCVDLDGAFAGHSVNADAIRSIRASVDTSIQLGGGIRDRQAIERWLETGIARVILGTAALRDPVLVREAAQAYPGCIVVGIDARSGLVAAEGWAKTSELDPITLAKRFEDAGVAALIFTDIARDGMLQGINIGATVELADAVRIPVIASGGVSGIADIQELADEAHPNILGIIIGRALYDGSIDPFEALSLAT